MAALDYYTFDSITLPAPNSLLAFCFSNVIIAILFLASSRNSNTDHDHDTPSAPVKDTRVNGDDVGSWHQHDITTAEESEALGEVTEEASASVDVVVEENSEDQEEECGLEEEEEEEDDDDDELRRRVEEFIAKVNQGWKAEHLRR